MSAFAAIALYPLWAVSVLVGVTAFRLGRSRPLGLVSLCLFHAVWVTGLVLLEHPQTSAFAERVLPAGMLLAGAFTHAGADLAGVRARRAVGLAYGWGVVVAVSGAVTPALFTSPGLTGPGPLFWPVAIVSTGGVVAVMVWMARAARATHGPKRRRIVALLLGCAFGSAGGGGAIALHLLGDVDVGVAAPLLFPGIGLVTWATLDAETGARRKLVLQGLIYAVLTAAFSSVGLVVFFFLLPELAPGGSQAPFLWLVVVTFFAALPLDSLRMLMVETIGRRVFRAPTGVTDLADAVEASETRADHAEALAEIGTMASAVAHEIRNPLGVIAARAKLLERKGADEKDVAALREQVERAKGFLDDLLTYSKPRPLSLGEVELRHQVERAIGTVADQLPDPPPPIEIAVAGDVVLEADADALHDVLVILLHNAAAALHGRDDPHVEVAARVDGDHVDIVVEDDGPGVSDAVVDRLFTPFVSGRGRDARHPGTGLGLAIAARWVQRHGGSIEHAPSESGGARFTIRWPRRAVDAAPLAEASR